MQIIRIFYLKQKKKLVVKFLVYLNRHVFVMYKEGFKSFVFVRISC